MAQFIPAHLQEVMASVEGWRLVVVGQKVDKQWLRLTPVRFSNSIVYHFFNNGLNGFQMLQLMKLEQIQMYSICDT